MAIITISRSCCSKGQEIAKQVAQQLGYSCFSRELLLETSTEFNIPELRLRRELHDAPSLLNQFTHGKERYMAFMRQAFLEHVQGDNVVYHGLAGHFFAQGLQHALKVRILTDLEERMRLEMKRGDLSRKEARRIIEKDDLERRKWSFALYGVDSSDVRLYDLVLYLLKIQTDEAVDIICSTARLRAFETTSESQDALNNLLVAAQVKSQLVGKWPTAQVISKDGHVSVRLEKDDILSHLESMLVQEFRFQREISELVQGLPGVKNVRVSLGPRDSSQHDCVGRSWN